MVLHTARCRSARMTSFSWFVASVGHNSYLVDEGMIGGVALNSPIQWQ